MRENTIFVVNWAMGIWDYGMGLLDGTMGWYYGMGRSRARSIITNSRNKQKNALLPANFEHRKTSGSAVNSDHDQPNCRLFITDKIGKTQFLEDTGADLSVLPASYKSNYRSTQFKLFAANGSSISTYGEKLLSLDFGLRRALVLADVTKPITGADFLRRYGL